MIIPKILLSLLIKLLIDIPMVILGFLVIPILLVCNYDMRKSPWGNLESPDGEQFWQVLHGTGFLAKFRWLAIRNSTHNLCMYGFLSHTSTGSSKRIAGTNEEIGNWVAEGWYFATEGRVWEFYYIKKISATKCFRFRAGWKLDRRAAGGQCQFVFAPSPYMHYTGI